MSTLIESQNKLEITNADFINKLQKLSTTLIWDKSYGAVVNISSGITNYTPDFKIAGPSFLVETDGAIMPVLQALDEIPQDYVLLVKDTGANSDALLGDIIVHSAKQQKLSGIVVLGNIRDVDAISTIGIPVWAKGHVLQAAKLGEQVFHFPSEINVNDGIIKNGDWIFGDQNGLVSINQDKLRLIIKSAQVKNRNENSCISQINGGEKITDLMNIKAYLNGSGQIIVPF